MKPCQFLFTTLVSTSAIGAVATVVGPSIADSRPPYSTPLPSLADSEQLIAALPTTDRLWVKVRSAISIEELADKLAQDETKLAKLNDVNEDHSFSSGDWLVLPSQSSKKVKQLAAIDTTELRRSPPLAAPPEPQEPARIRLGDSLAKIATRYNLSIGELLRLNPGLQAARLVAGTQIRVANSTPGRSRMILGLKPTASGGLSWPDQPDFGFGNDPGAELTDTADTAVRRMARNRPGEFKELNVWAFHGAKDPTVSVEESEVMVAALRKAGVIG